MPAGFGANGVASETPGISMRSSARSTAGWSICGTRSTRAGKCSTFSCRSAAIRKPPSGSFESC